VDWKRLAVAPRRKYGVRHYERYAGVKLDTYMGACGEVENLQLPLLTAVLGGGGNKYPKFKISYTSYSGVYFTWYEILSNIDTYWVVPIFVNKDADVLVSCKTESEQIRPDTFSYAFIVDPIGRELVHIVHGQVRSLPLERGVYLYVTNTTGSYAPACFSITVHVPPPSGIAALDIECIVKALRGAQVHIGKRLFKGAYAWASPDVYGIDLNVEI